MNVIDVYDIANSTWYKQATSGAYPPTRVNPCATVAMAPDGSSFNVYLYGGQNLIPFDEQIQYSDMWILTIPSFTWINVTMDGQSQPPARAGHSCVMWDGQVVSVGGYVGTDISCDSPGIYVFNASSLEWTSDFTALTSSSSSSDSSDSASDPDSTIIQGSVGYQVPGIVQSVIGGSSDGGATATQPAAGTPASGPFKTGKPPTFTVTQSGSTIIQTSQSTSTATSTSTPASKSGSKTGVIAAGTVAGVLALLAGYLAFCTWLYRKQLKLYKNHVAMAQRNAFTNSPDNGWNTENNSDSNITREKPGAGIMLGPFGTELGTRWSGSGGRPSVGESTSGSGSRSGNTPYNEGAAVTSVPTAYGGAAGFGNRYSRVSEGDENMEYTGAGGTHSAGIRSTANSSTEDLLGGNEPNFFSVVMNPRRTLRVVNSD